VGRWLLSVRSYRYSSATAASGAHINGAAAVAERSLWALTMNDNVFVLLEDPSAPYHSEVAAAAQAHEQAQAQAAQSEPGHTHHQPFIGPPHYRTTFVTLSPPGALEQLLQQLRARWAVRQSGISANRAQAGQRVAQGQQVTVDGVIYAIGTDWLVRAGNVMLAGGAPRGMLLEVHIALLMSACSFRIS
jgi:hypothetical protein